MSSRATRTARLWTASREAIFGGIAAALLGLLVAALRTGSVDSNALGAALAVAPLGGLVFSALRVPRGGDRAGRRSARRSPPRSAPALPSDWAGCDPHILDWRVMRDRK